MGSTTKAYEAAINNLAYCFACGHTEPFSAWALAHKGTTKFTWTCTKCSVVRKY